jgi:hypothetical protein
VEPNAPAASTRTGRYAREANVDPEEQLMTNLSRRALAFSLPAASIVGASGVSVRSGGAQAQTAQPRPVVPTAQIKVGRFTVTALSDGYADMPFSYFPGRTSQQIDEAAGAVFAVKPGGIRFVFNQRAASRQST